MTDEPRRLLLGPHAVNEGLTGGTNLEIVFVDPAARAVSETLLSRLRDAGVSVETRDSSELSRLAGDAKHQGIVGIAGAFQYRDLDDVLSSPTEPANPEMSGRASRLIVALDEVSDPHNMGAIVRSACALGATAVVCTQRRTSPITATVVRASAGASEHVPIVRVTNLAETLTKLRGIGFEAVGLAGDADTSLEDLGPSPETGRVVVVGSEGRGLRRLVRERCDVLARIPLNGPIASLNASVAAAIAIYQLGCATRAAGETG